MKNNIKKVVTAGLAGFVLGTTLTVSAGTWIQAYRNDEIKITLNGEVQTFRDATTNEIEVPITYNDRTYLPLRSLATLVGLNVDYDANTKTAILETKDYEGKKVKKIDETKDIVYIGYEENVENNVIAHMGITDTINVKIPSINVDSEHAKKINEEINLAFDEYIKYLKENKNEYIESEMHYNTSINDNILTVILINSSEYSNSIQYIYNIDIYTGKRLTNEEVLKINNIDASKIDLKEVYNQSFLEAFEYVIPGFLEDLFVENKKIDGDSKIANAINWNYNAFSEYYDNKNLNDTKYYLGDNKNIIAEIKMMSSAGAIIGTTQLINITEILKGKGNNWYAIKDSDKNIINEQKDAYNFNLNSELCDLSNEELNIAYNEIFARHGHDFQSQNLKEHFNNQIWYKPVAGKQVTLEELNEIEKENARIIKEEIEARKTLLANLQEVLKSQD